MSEIQTAPIQESQVITNPINEKNLKDKLNLWKHLTSSCYGPHGKNVSVQNVIGGHITITKSSSRLLELVRPSHPITQLVLYAIKNHVRLYGDFGLFAATLVFELLDAYDKSNLPQSVKWITCEHFSKLILSHLSNPENNCCHFKVDLTRVNDSMSVVKSIFKSKLFLLLENEISFLSSVLLETFLSLIPSNLDEGNNLKLGKLRTITHEGVSVKYSQFVSGFLYYLPNSQAPFQNLNLLNCKISLFKVSLAGDLCLPDLTIEVCQHRVIKDCAMKMLFDLARRLVQMKVKVVACQRVVHPKICKFLQSRDVIVFQRLGENGCTQMSKLTNSVPIASIIADNIQEKDFGTIRKTESISLHGKNYIRFFGCCGTVILCHNNEENLRELSVVFHQGFQSLLLLLHNPKVFVGGSCLEFHLAKVVAYEVNNSIRSEKVVQTLGISAGQFSEALAVVVNTLKKMGLNLLKSEISNHIECHCKCCKTMKIEENSIIDVAVGKFSAYKTAMETVSMLLKIGICIIDRN